MNTSFYDDMIAKAVIILQNRGIYSANELGTYQFFEDTILQIQAFRWTSADLVIKNTAGLTALEIWKGSLIVHRGDHTTLYRHLDRIFRLLD